MKYKDYGKEHAKTVILLHGGGLSWWNYRKEAELLKNEFRVIVPVLDGHAGSDRNFSSIERSAREIIALIDKRLGGSVDMICGLSLGGQILLEMLAQRGDICRHAMIESAMAFPSKMTGAMVRPAVKCYPLTKQKWFAKLQFASLRMEKELFPDYYRDTRAMNKDDLTAILKANASYRMKDTVKDCTADVHIYCGTKEVRGIRRSAKRIHKAIPASKLTKLPGMYHGEFSLNLPAFYANEVRRICQE